MLVAFLRLHEFDASVCRKVTLPLEGRRMMQAKVLIVDDEVVVAEDIRRQLRALGYHVIGVASSGADAIRLAADHVPDLILMDIKLKGPMDGIEAARTIQDHHDIPVIYLTAFADDETLERARNTLPLAYLIKPFVSSDLRAALELALFRHRVSRVAEQRGRWLNAVVQSMGDAVVTTDREGRVTLLNPAAEGLTGWSQAEAVGKAVEEVLILLDPETRQPLMSRATQALSQHIDMELGRRSALLRNRKGGECRISDTSALIHDERGAPAGIVMVFRQVAGSYR
jgi:PAS domain S-box-containing protein